MTAEAELSPLRVGSITGSRLGKLLGLSTFGGPEDLMREMVREHFGAEPEWQDNPTVEYGRKWESWAVEKYEAERGVFIHSAQVYVQHPEFPWIGITPDGLVDVDGGVEIKVPYRANYVHISQRPGYEAQCRLLAEVKRLAWVDFVVGRPDLPPDQQLWVSRVYHDPDWFPSVLPKIVEFRNRYLAIIADPEAAKPYLEPLQDVRTDPEWMDAAIVFQEAKATLAAAEAEVETARKALIDLADGKTSVGGGVRVQVSTRTGAVDYAKLTKKYAPDADVEAFRKASSTVVSVHLSGGRK